MASTELPTSTQEVRLATTMTGGVSLAIWMAGVTREINLLGQASQWRRSEKTGLPVGEPSGELKASLELYKELIDLLDIVVDVDILSGTSAGGINAALLALSRVKGCDLGGLRELWLELGALLDLIRDPTDKNTPSLLYGDERMFAVLADQIPKLAPGPFKPASPPPTTLYVTTSLLAGETSRFTDSFGTLVQDVDRRGLFTFTENQLADNDIAPALSLAARSSASFPLAFEPSFVPFEAPTPPLGGVPARPPMQAYANITRSHWVADGGLLDNQPIDVLLQRIFDSPAKRGVRRVLLFVVPSSGPTPDAAAPPQDDVNQPLGLVDGLLKDLSAMMTQSIAADLREIRIHQDRIQARTDARLRLAEFARRLKPRLLTEELLKDYVTREATKQAGILATALLRQLSTWPESGAPDESVPAKWQAELAVGGDAEKACRQGITDSILGHWPTDSLPEGLDEFAAYGLPAYELGKAVAIAVVQAAYEVAISEEDLDASKDAIAELAELIEAIHAAYEPITPTDLVALVRDVCTIPEVRAGTLTAAAAKLADEFFEQPGPSDAAWESLGLAFVNKWSILSTLASDDSSAPDAEKDSLRARRGAATRQLRIYLNYLVPEDGLESSDADVQVAMKLFDLAVTQRAMLPADADIDQSLELVQVSADTRSLLAPNIQTAQQKLTGMQFHHFGAFYKRSWRANDWMWGRLDGAGWLVHVLLEPQRVRWIVQAHANEHEPDPVKNQQGARWFLQKLKDLGGIQFPNGDFPLPPTADGTKQVLNEDTLLEELEFLDDTDKAIPPSIPWTSLWVAQAWQQRILDQELDGLADTVINAPAGTTLDWSPAESVRWAEDVRATKGADKYRLLKTNAVAKENFSTDKSSPLMAHTITKAAATTSSAVRGVRQLPGVLKPPVITMQTLALGGYRVVSLTKGVARSSIKIGAALLVVGVIAATQNVTLIGVSGLIAAWIGGYLIVLGTWQSSSKPGTVGPRVEKKPSRIRQWLSKAKTQWRRSKIRARLSNSKIWQRLSRPLVPLLSVTLVGAMLTLAAPCSRNWLFGKGQHDSGVVGSHVHWLGEQWWHPLIAVGVIALSITLVGIAVRPRRK